MRIKRTLMLVVLALIVVGIPVALFAIHTYYLPLDLLIRRGAGAAGSARADSKPAPGRTLEKRTVMERIQAAIQKAKEQRASGAAPAPRRGRASPGRRRGRRGRSGPSSRPSRPIRR